MSNVPARATLEAKAKYIAGGPDSTVYRLVIEAAESYAAACTCELRDRVKELEDVFNQASDAHGRAEEEAAEPPAEPRVRNEELVAALTRLWKYVQRW